MSHVNVGNAGKEGLTGGRWATIEGAHVYIKDGKVAAGPAALKGKTPGEASNSDSKTAMGASARAHETGSAEHHEAAVVAHTKAAVSASKAGDDVSAGLHEQYANDHEASAMSARIGGKKLSPSDKARGASALADSTGRAVDHDKAADAHSRAARAASAKGDDVGAGLHEQASDEHASKSVSASIGKAGGRGTHNSNSLASNNEGGSMPVKLTDEQRQQIVRALTGNSCACQGYDVPWKGKNATTLNQTGDDQLYEWYLWNRSLVQAQAQGGGGGQVATSPHNPPPAGRGSVNNSSPPVVVPPAPARPQSMEEWLTLMPPQAKEIWNSAVEVHNAEKGRLIGRLIANMQDGEERDQTIQYLNTKDLEELRRLLKFAQSPEPQPPVPVANYFGAAAPVSVQPGTSEEPLTSPAYNFANP